MKFGTEKNEIAGATAQKVPTAPVKEGFSAKLGVDLTATSGADRSASKQDLLDSALAANWTIKASDGNVEAVRQTTATASADPSASPAERLAHLLNQQVVMIRQSSANNLAVSLKLDPQTELSVQLTKHNGQVEASVRWERGSVAGMESHWKDLQDSLARQNVVLLPLESKASPRPPPSYSTADTLSGSHHHQSSQNPQRQNRGAPRNPPAETTLKTVPVTNKATTRTASRQGWESWA
jgi:hypothetical protein